MRVGREGGLGLEWYGGYFEAGAQVGLGLVSEYHEGQPTCRRRDLAVSTDRLRIYHGRGHPVRLASTSLPNRLEYIPVDRIAGRVAEVGCRIHTSVSRLQQPDPDRSSVCL